MNVPFLFYPILSNVRNTIHTNGSCFRLLSAACSQRSYSNKPFQPFTVVKQEDGSEKKKRKTVIPKITLISQDESISITTLEEAEKLSKRRELKLVKLVDYNMKTERPVYKLMTGAEYLQEDLKQRELRKTERDTSNAIKGDKVLIINYNISEHDLKTQLNKITKWISKHYEVKVVINGNASNMEKAVRDDCILLLYLLKKFFLSFLGKCL